MLQKKKRKKESKMSLELIKELRNRTSAGMNDCRQALMESENDLNKAEDIIKARGLLQAAKKTGVAAEGLIFISHDFLSGSVTMTEINVQTDFAAKSPEFQKFAHQISNLIATGTDPETTRQEAVATIKENIVVRRTVTLPKDSDLYLHNNQKVGVIGKFNGVIDQEIKDGILMQVAAMSPLAISRDQVDAAEVERQTKIFEQQIAEMKKAPPEAARTKILEGKLNKWFSDVCLMEQAYLLDTTKTIKQLLGESTIEAVYRFEVGEGIEKVSSDFAAEVAKMAN